MNDSTHAFIGGPLMTYDEPSSLYRLGVALGLLRGEFVAQANRMILANVAFWPSRKKGKAKLPRRAAKQLSIVKRLRRERESAQ